MVMLASFAYRYIFVLVDEAERMERARDSRCYGGRWLWHAKVIGQMIGTLFLRSYERAERVYVAMVSRGFDGRIVAPAEPRMAAADCAFVAASVGFFVALRVHGMSDTNGAVIAGGRALLHATRTGSARSTGFRWRSAYGEKVGLIGANGAGKSTLLLHLNGILPCNGRVRVLGMKVEKPNLKAIRQSVGLVFQNPDDQLFCPTVGDDVAFGPRQLRLPEAEIAARVRESLAAVGLRGFEARSAFHMSFGEKKRVAIATVLSMNPKVLALDEPTSNLDPRSRKELIRLLQPPRRHADHRLARPGLRPDAVRPRGAAVEGQGRRRGRAGQNPRRHRAAGGARAGITRRPEDKLRNARSFRSPPAASASTGSDHEQCFATPLDTIRT